MTDQTKAPERIWLCLSESTEDGLAWVARAHENDWDQCFIRADIAAEHVREAREAILTALADIPHPESTDAAEALERAYRAAEVAADMPEGSVRSIKETVRAENERLRKVLQEIVFGSFQCERGNPDWLEIEAEQIEIARAALDQKGDA